MAYSYLWVICLVITVILASKKNRNLCLWLVFAVFFAPLALILILAVPEKKIEKKGRAGDGIPLPDIKEELKDLKNKSMMLLNRIEALEAKLNIAPSGDAVSALRPQENAPQEAVKAVKESALRKSSDMEMNVGRFWLNKAGIIIFALGIASLITYTFKYFSALAKIISGYLISYTVFFVGARLEKKARFMNYGRALIGGAWALIYFTTYAMYHFDASRVINSQLLDLLLLAIVAAGIIMHSLKYKSQELFSLALFVAYFTATLGDVTYFTFLTCALLAVVALIMVYKMQWWRTIFVGIILTYLTHYFWVFRQISYSTVPVGRLNVAETYFFVNAGFLFIYWLVFVCGIHLIRTPEGDAAKNKLCAANYCNFLLYFLIFYPDIYRMYPQHKFAFFITLGVIYLALSLITERIKNDKLFSSNMLIALSLLTLAVPLKFMAFHTTLIWLIELPFLLIVGLRFDRKVFRYFVYALAPVLFFKILCIDFSMKNMVCMFGHAFSWIKFISFLGFISMAACFSEMEYSKASQAVKPIHPENKFHNLFSALAALYFTIFIWQVVDLRWLTLSLAIETLGILVLSLLLSNKLLRLYALLLALTMSFRFCFIDHYRNTGELVKWLVLACEILAVYCVYFLYKLQRSRNEILQFEYPVVNGVFMLSTFLFTYTMFRYAPRAWISLGLGIEGVILFLVGFLGREKIFRYGALTIFAVTLARVVFVDLSMLHIIYKIISFIVLGVLFLGISYIYTKYNIPKERQ